MTIVDTNFDPSVDLSEVVDESQLEVEVGEDEQALLSGEQLKLTRSSQQPDISRLRDAIVKDIFVPVKGDYIVVEQYSLFDKDHPWLDTRVYLLLRDATQDGYMKLYDAARGQCAQMNWKIGLKNGFVFKMPPSNVNPETLFESASGRRKKFERPTKVVYQQKTVISPGQLGDPTGNGPRRRGRPSGSKNRSREEVVLEKKLQREKLAIKRQKRDARGK